MCGISAFFSNDNNLIQDAISKKEISIDTIQKRGPNDTVIVNDKDFLSIHTHLRITGDCQQPVYDDDFLLLFNGEIYNDYEKYDSKYSDTHYLTEQIKNFGDNAFEKLDGEFAICLREFKTNTLILVTDPFGTKPLYYQLGKNFVAVGSYESTISAYGKIFPIIQVPSNTCIKIDLNEFKIKQRTIIRPFDFSNQKTETFEKWNLAFQKSVIKRGKNLQQKCFISFSAGHDSGIIAAEMLNLKMPFHVYTDPYLENTDILNQRLEILDKHDIKYNIIKPTDKEFNSMHEYLLENCEAFQLINTESLVQNFKDPDIRNIPGYIAYAIINKKAREDGNLISLSGQGSDEVYADYYNEFTNSKMSELKGNWNSISKPWTNFHAGWNRVFLGGGERIAGIFGIETRYPLLDFYTVQEFLNLTPTLKSKSWKSPLTNRLEELHFPFHLRKQGFAGGNPEILSQKS
jgi:asparagine synthetase B (glutamine-hydrolysing)